MLSCSNDVDTFDYGNIYGMQEHNKIKPNKIQQTLGNTDSQIPVSIVRFRKVSYNIICFSFSRTTEPYIL